MRILDVKICIPEVNIRNRNGKAGALKSKVWILDVRIPKVNIQNRYGKARALKEKAEYEKFLEMWKDADKDMPALVAARAEYESLA